MHILNSLAKHFYRRKQSPAQIREQAPTAEQELFAQIGYHRLETRLVLSASWSLAGGLLTLDGFDPGQDLTFSQADVDIGGSTVDAYIFEVDMGDWTGVLEMGIELENGGATLEVAASLLTVGLAIDGGDNIGVTQGSAFSIANFGISNFSLTDQSFSLDVDAHVQLENISVTDTDPNDALNTQIFVQATGSIDVNGTIINQSTNQAAAISLEATGIDSDITTNGADIQTGAGDVLLIAADEISLLDNLGVSTTILSGGDGAVVITANSDDADGDSSDGILMSDGSIIDATDGDIALSAIGADGGDITLGNLTTTGAVSVEATGQIVDGTVNEIANIVGTRTDLIGSSIGANDDIDIEVDNLSFNSTGDVQITDLVGSLTIDAISTAQNDVKLIVGDAAGEDLVITQAIDLGTGELFLDVAGNVTQSGLGTITAGGLALMVDGTTRLQLGNDVNTLASATGDTILYNDVDGLTIGTVTVLDGTADEMQIIGITTLGDDVKLIAGGDLAIAQPIDLGAGDLFLDVAGNVTQFAPGTITAGGLALMVDGTTRLQLGNDVNTLASATGDTILYNDVDGLTIGTVTVLDGTADEMQIIGITTLGDDVKLIAGGDLAIAQPIDLGAGDLFLDVAGNVSQTAAGTITAGGLALMVDGTSVLHFDNDVDRLAADSGGAILFNDIDELTVDTVTVLDGTADEMQIIGITTSSDDVFIQTDGYLLIEQAIDVAAGDVRLVANGDVLQSVNGTITADQLGVRQEAGVYNVNEDLDLNGRFDIILDDQNDIDRLAADNAFDTGVFVFNDVDDVTVGTVAPLASGNMLFALTVGITTTFTGATNQGPGDIADGDVLINADGFLLIEQAIDAGGGGTADVRLVADGDLHQTVTGVIFADELGARQESSTFSAADDIDSNGLFDVMLCFDNRVSFFAAENQFSGGSISFVSDTAFDIAAVSAQTIGNVSFAATTGVVADGNVLLQSSTGAINITNTIDAAGGTVYLVANGDILQSAGDIIIAAGLGVRQEATVYDAAEDLDGNGFFDIILTEDNMVGMFAAENVYQDGVIAFHSIESLTIFAIPDTNFCNVTFSATDGVVAEGDILIETDGYLEISAPINAGNGSDDVRLIASGDIIQNAGGMITADELGIRQQRLLFDSTYDLDGNGSLDILLCEGNQVITFAANNPLGDIYFHNDQDLVVGEVLSQTIGNINFTITTGITAGNDAVVQADGSLQIDEAVSAGDEILLQANGYIFIDAPLDAVQVRLIGNGDIIQSASGTITADILGVRQEASVFNAAGDLDPNGFFDVLLDDGNDVDIFAAFNDFENGVIVFNDIDDLTVEMVDAVVMVCGESFAQTDGIEGRGDILVQSGGFLSVEQEINADDGADDVRLIALADITQLATGIIVADELGVRQEGPVGDVLLCYDNQVDTFAAFNPVGDVHFHNVQNLVIGSVASQTIGNISFGTTTGIATAGNSIIVSAVGNLQIDDAIIASEVRLIGNGDITQSASGTITSNILGVRQESLAAGDIILDDGNDVDIFAAFNAFDSGLTALNDVDDLTIANVDPVNFCSQTFADTVGIVSRGDVLIQSGDFISIEQQINADSGADDVRLIAIGNITQMPDGVIVADELGARQEGPVGDILLCYDNQVNTFAASDPVGDVQFHNVQDLIIGNVATQTIGNITFGTTTGVTAFGNSIILSAVGDLQISDAVIADEVRLIANGDITQSAAGTITSNILGVRQESAVGGDVILDDGNDVNIFAAFNEFQNGVIVFSDVDDLTISAASAVIFCNQTFANTVGIDGRGDILIQAGGFVAIEQEINADDGAGDVRLISGGDITQTPAGIVIADELGARQESMVGISNIVLDQANDVRVFSAFNASDGGVIVMNDTDQVVTINLGLTIDNVAGQSIGNIAFVSTSGVSTTFTGAAMAGAADVDSGDILINSDGFLQINDQLNAGNADIRLTANGDIIQNSNGVITANELGVGQQANVVDPDYDLDGNGQYDILLGESSGGDRINDVDNLAMINRDRNGQLLFRDTNDLTIDRVSAQTICDVTFDLVSGVTSDDGATGIASDGMGDITLEADQALNDGNNIPIITGGRGLFRGDVEIELADQVGDQLLIGENAAFVSPDIEIGQDSAAAGNGNVLFGSLTVNDLGSGTGTADITEDDGTLLANGNSTGTLILTSGENITNAADTTIELDHVQFNAENGSVFIGNMANDLFASQLNDEIQIGTFALDVSIAADSSVELNGLVPIIDNMPHDLTVGEFDLGTNVTGTLFVTSTGHIEQTIGDLNARQLGLIAANHVHLESVSANNQLLAVSAGDSTVAANLASHQAVLDNLQAIPGSEVRADLIQSISIVHQGDLVVGNVLDPDLGGSLVGVSTTATDDGSIFLMAMDSISITADISAVSENSLPQVTVYVQNAVANDASRITFNNDAAIEVTGKIGGTVVNHGIVNDAQTVAIFGVDTDGDDIIDAFYFDANSDGIIQQNEIFQTTAIIRLDGGSNTAEQLIESIYGHPGEEGYRFAFVWDSQRRFDLGFGFDQEIPNLYTIFTDNSERFDVLIFDPDNSGDTMFVLGTEFTFQTSLIEQIASQGGDFNFDTVFAKIDAWTRDALSARIDDPRVFTTVEVRNDQDINLFVGAIGNADNSLNAVSQTLEARIETPGFALPSTPFVLELNPVRFEHRPEPLLPLITYIETFDQPELKRLDDPGQLSWIAVEIDNPDDDDDTPEDNLLEVDGELILKNPQIEYDPLNEDEKPEKITEASRNEYQKIIEAIENDPKAEAGLWYKIFIDYKDPGKKDELLFYYYKTGDRQEQDLGPSSDFDGNIESGNDLPAPPAGEEPDADGAAADGKQHDPLDASGQDAELAPLNVIQVTGPVHSLQPDSDFGSEIETARELTGSEKLGISSGSMLLAMIASGNNKGERRPVLGLEPLQNARVGFSRFDRLKRRVTAMIGK